MLKVVPGLEYLPTLTPLEMEVVRNFQKYFTSPEENYRNVTLYVHPDTINADISMVLDDTFEYKNREYHQLWLVNVVNENDNDYYRDVYHSAKDINKFKTQFRLNRAFKDVNYPDFLQDQYKYSCESKKFTLKQRNAINTLIIGSKKYAEAYINKINTENQEEVVEKIEDIFGAIRNDESQGDDKYNYIIYSHGMWSNDMQDKGHFHTVMERRKNVWTALTLGEYNVAKYFIGINLKNKNLEVRTTELLSNKKVASVINTDHSYNLVKGGAKTGKTTLLALKAFNSIKQNKTITITSFTYANLSGIRLKLQQLLGENTTLKIKGVKLMTVSSIIYNKSEIDTDELYIDNAEDLTKKQINYFLNNNEISGIFIAYNGSQKIIFNEQEGNFNLLENKKIKDKFNKYNLNRMINHCAPSIEMIYGDFLKQSNDGQIIVHNGKIKSKSSVFIYDDENRNNYTLSNDELDLIKRFIDKKIHIDDNAGHLNQHCELKKDDTRVLIISPKFDPLVQISMYLGDKKYKKMEAFLTYRDIINETTNISSTLKFQTAKMKTFEELRSFLIRQASTVFSDKDEDVLLSKYVDRLKTEKIQQDEYDLHRYFPAMESRIILTTLESFKGTQAENVIAILPPGRGLINGNLGTILSSATNQLFLINKNKEFHNFVVNEPCKKKYPRSSTSSILSF